MRDASTPARPSPAAATGIETPSAWGRTSAQGGDLRRRVSRGKPWRVLRPLRRPRDPSRAYPIPLKEPPAPLLSLISSPWTRSPALPTTPEPPESSSARPQSSSDRTRSTSARMDTLWARTELKHRHGGTKYHLRGTKDQRGGTKDHRGGRKDHRGGTKDSRGGTNDHREGTTSTRPATSSARVRTTLPSSDLPTVRAGASSESRCRVDT